MVWAILKCQYWLRGINHFTVMSDQIALSHIYSGNRELSDFPEEIRNLAEATMAYNFNVCYVRGQDNVLADYFSRNPLWGYGQPVADDIYSRLALVEALVRQVQSSIDRRRAEDPALTSIKEQASMDDGYCRVLDTLKFLCRPTQEQCIREPFCHHGNNCSPAPPRPLNSQAAGPNNLYLFFLGVY